MKFKKKSRFIVTTTILITALLAVGAGVSRVHAHTAPSTTQSPTVVSNVIQRGSVTVARAHEIAVAMVGGGDVAETRIGFYSGSQVYRIEVEYGESRYRVVIAVNGGAVVRFEQRTSTNTEIATTPAPNTKISQAEAVEIAVAHLTELGIEQGDLAYALRILREGRMVWDVEFRHGYFEYEFLVDAVTGEIVDFEIEESSRYHAPRTTAPTTTPTPATPSSSTHAPAPTQRPNQNPQHPMTFSYSAAVDVALELIGGGTVTVAALGFYHGSSVYQLTVEYSGSRFQIFVNTADGTVERFRAR